ncbi:MAG: hypothetical protein KKE12_20750, partial [Proteobacteria bacterium]|nr:hypothetical protein [Pseudomonadota bacterium]
TILTAAANVPDTTITVSDTSSFKVNGLVTIADSITANIEIHVVTAIEGDVLTLATALTSSYNTGTFVDGDDVSVPADNNDSRTYTLRASSADPSLSQVTFHASYPAFSNGSNSISQTVGYPQNGLIVFDVQVKIPPVNNYSPINTTPCAFYAQGEDKVCNAEEPTDTNTINLRAVDSTCPTSWITKIFKDDLTDTMAIIPAADGIPVHISADDNDLDPTTTDLKKVSLEFSSDNGQTWIVIDSFACTEDQTYPLQLFWNTRGLSGDYLLRSVATDEEGNSCPSTTIMVKVDNMGIRPLVEVPEDGADTGGSSVTVTAWTVDSGAQTVKFQFRPVSGDTSTWYDIGPATTIFDTGTQPTRWIWTTTWNTTGLEDEWFYVRAISTDNLSNEYVGDSITVNIDNTINCDSATLEVLLNGSSIDQIGGDNYIPGPDQRVVTLQVTKTDTDIVKVEFSYDNGETVALDTTIDTTSADSTIWETTFRGTRDSIPRDYNADIVFTATLYDNVGNSCTKTITKHLRENYDPTSCIVEVTDQDGVKRDTTGLTCPSCPTERFSGSELNFYLTAHDNGDPSNGNIECVSLAYFKVDTASLHLTTKSDSGTDTIAVSNFGLINVDDVLCIYDSVTGDTTQTVKVVNKSDSILTVRPALSDTYAANAGVGIWVIDVDGQDCSYPYDDVSLDVSDSNGCYVFSSSAKDLAGGNVEYPEWDNCAFTLQINHNFILDGLTAYSIQPCTAGETTIASVTSDSVTADTTVAVRVTADNIRFRSDLDAPDFPGSKTVSLYHFSATDTTPVLDVSKTVTNTEDTVAFNVDVSDTTIFPSDVYFFWMEAAGQDACTTGLIALAIDNDPPRITNGPEIQGIKICDPTIMSSGDDTKTFDLGLTLFVGTNDTNDTYIISVNVSDTGIPNSNLANSEDTWARVKEVKIEYILDSGATFTDITSDSTTAMTTGICTASWNTENILAAKGIIRNDQPVTLQITMTDSEDAYTTACSNIRVDTFTFHADNVAPEARVNAVDVTPVTTDTTPEETVYVWGEDVLLTALVDFNPYDNGRIWQATTDIEGLDSDGASFDVCRVDFYAVNSMGNTVPIGSVGDSTDTDGDNVGNVYSVRWQSPSMGIYSVFAVATDRHGNREDTVPATEWLKVIVQGPSTQEITLGGVSIPESNNICDDNDTPIAADNFGNPVFESGDATCRKTKVSGDDLDLYLTSTEIDNIETDSVKVELINTTTQQATSTEKMTLVESGDTFDYIFRLYESDFPYYSTADSTPGMAKFEDVQVVVVDDVQGTTTRQTMIHEKNDKDKHVWTSTVALTAGCTYTYSFLIDAVGSDTKTDDPRNLKANSGSRSIVVPSKFYHANISLRSLAEGSYTIKAQAKDIRDWEPTEVSKPIIIDRTPPDVGEIEVALDPVCGAVVKAGKQVIVYATVSDPTGDTNINIIGVKKVLFQWSKDGNTQDGTSMWYDDIGEDTNGANGWSANWTPRIDLENNTVLRVRAVVYDDGHNGLLLNDGIAVTVDREAPMAWISSPVKDTQFTKGEIITLAAATTDTADIAGIVFEWTMGDSDAVTGETWTVIPAYTYSDTDIVAGDGWQVDFHTAETNLPETADYYVQVRARAIDCVGNVDPAPVPTILLHNDKTAPSAWLEEIKNNCGTKNVLNPYLAVTEESTLNGKTDGDAVLIEIEIMSDDPADTWKELGRVSVTPPATAFDYSWNAATYDEGIYYLRVRATDADGNTSQPTERVKIVVDHTQPEVKSFEVSTLAPNKADSILFTVDADATTADADGETVETKMVYLQYWNSNSAAWMPDPTFTSQFNYSAETGLWTYPATSPSSLKSILNISDTHTQCEYYLRALAEDWACNSNTLDSFWDDTMSASVIKIKLDTADPIVEAVYAGNRYYEAGAIVDCGGDEIDVYVKVQKDDCSGIDESSIKFFYRESSTTNEWKEIKYGAAVTLEDVLTEGTTGYEYLYTTKWITPPNQKKANMVYEVGAYVADEAANDTYSWKTNKTYDVTVQRDCTIPAGTTVKADDCNDSNCVTDVYDGLVDLTAATTGHTDDYRWIYDTSVDDASSTATVDFYYSSDNGTTWQQIYADSASDTLSVSANAGDKIIALSNGLGTLSLGDKLRIGDEVVTVAEASTGNDVTLEAGLANAYDKDCTTVTLLRSGVYQQGAVTSLSGGDSSPGVRTITVASGTGFAEDDRILITGGSDSEAVTVVSVSDNGTDSSIVITPGLTYDYSKWVNDGNTVSVVKAGSWTMQFDSRILPNGDYLIVTDATDWAGNTELESTRVARAIDVTIDNPKATVSTSVSVVERGDTVLIEATPYNEIGVAQVDFYYTTGDPTCATTTWDTATDVSTKGNTDTNMTEGNYAIRWNTSTIPLSKFMDSECNCIVSPLTVYVVGIARDDDCRNNVWPPPQLTDSDTFSRAVAEGRYLTLTIKDTTAPKITLTQISYKNDCMSDSKTLILPQEAEDMIISGLVDITARSERVDDLNTGSAYVTFMYSKDGNTWDTIDMDPIHTYDNDSVD